MTKLKFKIQLLKKFETQNSSALRKIDIVANHIVKNSAVQARRIQQQYKEHIMEIKDIEKEKKLLEKELQVELQVTQASYKNLQKNFNEKLGIFQTKFCNVTDNMKLQCQVYHSVALVGNDVHKLTKDENISNISTVLNLC